MSGNFNAIELRETIKQLDTVKQNINNIVSSISNDFNSLSGIVSSEDSSLSATCSNISGTYRNVSAQFTDGLNTLGTYLTKYVESTLENEILSSKNVAEIRESLERINNILSGI